MTDIRSYLNPINWVYHIILSGLGHVWTRFLYPKSLIDGVSSTHRAIRDYDTWEGKLILNTSLLILNGTGSAAKASFRLVAGGVKVGGALVSGDTRLLQALVLLRLLYGPAVTALQKFQRRELILKLKDKDTLVRLAAMADLAQFDRDAAVLVDQELAKAEAPNSSAEKLVEVKESIAALESHNEIMNQKVPEKLIEAQRKALEDLKNGKPSKAQINGFIAANKLMTHLFRLEAFDKMTEEAKNL